MKLLWLPGIAIVFAWAQPIPQELQSRAAGGDKQAQIDLAKGYEREGRIEKAMYWYKQAALNGKKPEPAPAPMHSDKPYQQRVVEKTTHMLREVKDPESSKSLLQMITADFGLYPYKQNYILPYSYDFKQKSDRRQKETVLQISVQMPLVDNYFGFDEVISAGYTQKSWWQTYAGSKPFRETNHSPELFMTLPTPAFSPLQVAKFGLKHSSNGRSGLESRSWNSFYTSGYFQFENIFLRLSGWYRFPESGSDPNDPTDDDNPDLIDYYGDGEVELQYLYGSHIFSATWRYALDGLDRGAYELQWSFPVDFLLSSDKVYGVVNYFNGYGESLIDYNRKVERIGIGLQLSR